MERIYLDHNATTPTRPEVIEAMRRCLAQGPANPASRHQAGGKARRILEEAREKIAQLLDCRLQPPYQERLIFTSGGTEANNLAVFGIAAACGQTGRVVISAAEHASVLVAAEQLLESGWRLDTVGLSPTGVVRCEQLASLLDSPPSLVSISCCNHETGVLQPIGRIAEMCNAAGTPFHTDAVQAAGKIPLSFHELGVAAMSISAHKFQGPAGIGALLIRRDVTLRPLFFGGNQQEGLRPGTEPVALALGMAVALELSLKELHEQNRRLAALREHFEQQLAAEIPGILINGANASRVAQTSNITFPDVDGEMLRLALDLAGVDCSVGAACSSGSAEPSPTLRAMGLSGEQAAASFRFSFGTTTTTADIDEALVRIVRTYRRVKSGCNSEK